ncbi:MAG: class I SAM-dependent methyltransferase [Leptolyngbya sp. SIO1E4]|nr:class I SAM-dependent methyltransferase [Leptolyngbya sp. SIO1E4]
MSRLDYFSDVAKDYEKYRPSYPPAAIDKLLVGVRSDSKIVAADIGAGTGIGSRLLAQRGIQVLAIEPNPQMRAVATPNNHIRFIAGTAEKIPLSTASVDLVSSFQAFHWFDFEHSLQEFGRILKPSGRLALLWSFWDQTDPFSKYYTRLLYEAAKHSQQPMPQFQSATTQRTGWAKWRSRWQYWLFWQGFQLPGFRHLQKHEFTYRQTLDVTGLIGCARSQGFVPASGSEFDDLAAQLRILHRQWANQQGYVRLAYRTYLFTAVSAGI